MIEAGMTGGILVGALAGSVIPVVGTITGAIVGGAYMYFRGKKRGERETLLKYRLEANDAPPDPGEQ